MGGPGVLHAMAGVGNANINAWPMLMLAGSSETALVGKGAFQELDAISLLMPHTKTAMRLGNLERVAPVIEEAYRLAFWGRSGPTFVDIPANIIQRTLSDQADLSTIPGSRPEEPRSVPPYTVLQEAASLLRSAKAPLVVIGKGAAYACAESYVRALIERTQIPFLPTPMGKGVVPDSHSLNVASARSAALKGADVVLLLGARLNWILHFGLPPKWRDDVKFIHVDIEVTELSRNVPSLNLLGDLGFVVPALTDLLSDYTYSPSTQSPYLTSLSASKEKNLAIAGSKAAPPKSAQDPMSIAHALTVINNTLTSLSPSADGDIVFISEGANTMDTARSIFSLEHPRQRLDAGTHATMGVGMGYAVAAWEAYNGVGRSTNSTTTTTTTTSGVRKKIVCIEGDSAFGFSGMEIETMARYGMDILVFVINNGGVYHGDADSFSEWQHLQARRTGPGAKNEGSTKGLRSTSLSYATRYEVLATACGGGGFFVETPHELERATREGFEFGKVCVVNVMVESGKAGELKFAWQESGGREKGKDAKL